MATTTATKQNKNFLNSTSSYLSKFYNSTIGAYEIKATIKVNQ